MSSLTIQAGNKGPAPFFGSIAPPRLLLLAIATNVKRRESSSLIGNTCSVRIRLVEVVTKGQTVT